MGCALSSVAPPCSPPPLVQSNNEHDKINKNFTNATNDNTNEVEQQEEQEEIWLPYLAYIHLVLQSSRTPSPALVHECYILKSQVLFYASLRDTRPSSVERCEQQKKRVERIREDDKYTEFVKQNGENNSSNTNSNNPSTTLPRPLYLHLPSSSSHFSSSSSSSLKSPATIHDIMSVLASLLQLYRHARSRHDNLTDFGTALQSLKLHVDEHKLLYSSYVITVPLYEQLLSVRTRLLQVLNRAACIKSCMSMHDSLRIMDDMMRLESSRKTALSSLLASSFVGNDEKKKYEIQAQIDMIDEQLQSYQIKNNQLSEDQILYTTLRPLLFHHHLENQLQYYFYATQHHVISCFAKWLQLPSSHANASPVSHHINEELIRDADPSNFNPDNEPDESPNAQASRTNTHTQQLSLHISCINHVPQQSLNSISGSLISHEPSRLFILTGDGATGKTCLLSKMMEDFSPLILSCHFCTLNNMNSFNGNIFVQTLAYQLSCRLSSYRDILLSILPSIDMNMSSFDLFQQLVIQPLHQYKREPHELEKWRNDIKWRYPKLVTPRFCIVVDGLQQTSLINDVASTLFYGLSSLPEWLCVVITCRDVSTLQHSLMKYHPTIYQVNQMKSYKDDMKSLIRHCLEPVIRNDLDEAVNVFLAKIHGDASFLYARLILQCFDILPCMRRMITADMSAAAQAAVTPPTTQLTLQNMYELPDGIDTYLRELFVEEHIDETTRCIIEIILCAQAPITIVAIAECLHISTQDVENAMQPYRHIFTMQSYEDSHIYVCDEFISAWLTRVEADNTESHINNYMITDPYMLAQMQAISDVMMNQKKLSNKFTVDLQNGHLRLCRYAVDMFGAMHAKHASLYELQNKNSCNFIDIDELICASPTSLSNYLIRCLPHHCHASQSLLLFTDHVLSLQFFHVYLSLKQPMNYIADIAIVARDVEANIMIESNKEQQQYFINLHSHIHAFYHFICRVLPLVNKTPFLIYQYAYALNHTHPCHQQASRLKSWWGMHTNWVECVYKSHHVTHHIIEVGGYSKSLASVAVIDSSQQLLIASASNHQIRIIDELTQLHHIIECDAPIHMIHVQHPHIWACTRSHLYAYTFSGVLQHSFPTENRHIIALDVSSDHRVAIAWKDHGMTLWNPIDGSSMEFAARTILCMFMGELLISLDFAFVTVWKQHSIVERSPAHINGYDPLCGCVTHDAQWLLTCGSDGSLFVWQLHDEQFIKHGRLKREDGHNNMIVHSIDIRANMKNDADSTSYLLVMALTNGVVLVFTLYPKQLLLTPIAEFRIAAKCVKWLPGNQMKFTCGCEDKMVRIVHIDSSLSSAIRSPVRISHVLYARDGSMLTGCADGRIICWNQEGVENWAIDAHVRPVDCISLAYYNNTLLLASASRDGTLRTYNCGVSPPTAILSTFSAPHGNCFACHVSNDGTHVAVVGFSSRLHIFDAATGEIVAALSSPGLSHSIYAVAWSSDNQHVATGSDDCVVRLWHVPSGALIKRMHGHTGAVNTLCFLPDGRRLLSGSTDENIMIWDTDTAALLRTIHTDHSVWCLAVSHNARMLAWCSDSDVRIHLWQLDTAANDTSQLIDVDKYVPFLTFQPSEFGHRSVCFSPDARFVASAGSDGVLRVHTLMPPAGRCFPFVHPQSSKQEPNNMALYTCAWSSCGRYIASGGLEQALVIWEFNADKHTAKLHKEQRDAWGRIYSCCFTPDSTNIFYTAAEHQLHCLSTSLIPGSDTLPNTGNFSFLTNAICSLSNNGKLLASGGTLTDQTGDSSIFIWDIAATHHPTSSSPAAALRASSHASHYLPSAKLKGHTQNIDALSWDTRGRLASAAKHEVKIWNVDDTLLVQSSSILSSCITITPLISVSLHPGIVSSLQWSSDNLYLLGGLQNSTYCWYVPNSTSHATRRSGTLAQSINHHRVKSITEDDLAWQSMLEWKSDEEHWCDRVQWMNIRDEDVGEARSSAPPASYDEKQSLNSSAQRRWLLSSGHVLRALPSGLIASHPHDAPHTLPVGLSLDTLQYITSTATWQASEPENGDDDAATKVATICDGSLITWNLQGFFKHIHNNLSQSNCFIDYQLGAVSEGITPYQKQRYFNYTLTDDSTLPDNDEVVLELEDERLATYNFQFHLCKFACIHKPITQFIVHLSKNNNSNSNSTTTSPSPQ